MNLIDVGDIDHRERGVDRYPGAGFFPGFADCCFASAFTVLHEAGRQRPVAEARFNCPFAKQDSVLPFGNAADDQTGILVMDVTARGADQAREVVAVGYPADGLSAACDAEGHGVKELTRSHESITVKIADPVYITDMLILPLRFAKACGYNSGNQ